MAPTARRRAAGWMLAVVMISVAGIVVLLLQSSLTYSPPPALPVRLLQTLSPPPAAQFPPPIPQPSFPHPLSPGLPIVPVLSGPPPPPPSSPFEHLDPSDATVLARAHLEPAAEQPTLTPDVEFAPSHKPSEDPGIDRSMHAAEAYPLARIASDANLSWLEDFRVSRKQRENYRTSCKETIQYLEEYTRRMADMASVGVVVMDWSVRGKFNGIGNEIQHYLEMLAIGLSTRRVAFVQTQLASCPGTLLDRDSGKASSAQLSNIAKQCHFDLGDFFEMDSGVSWKWDQAQRREVQRQLGPEVEEVLIRWTSKGMMWSNKKLAGPEENLIAKLMDTDIWRTSKWIRVSVEQEFGRWCHPTKRADGGSDFGMCDSYRWAVGIEGHRPAQVRGGGGSCFGHGVMQPKPFLLERLVQPLRDIELLGWRTVIGMHLRTGFSDVSAVPRPSLHRQRSLRPSHYEPHHLDTYISKHVHRLKFPSPHCPEASAGATAPLWDNYDAGGLLNSSRKGALPSPHGNSVFAFFNCGITMARLREARKEAAGQGQGDGDAWGLFLSTDSPTVKALALEHDSLGGPKHTVSSGGVFGHVTIASSTCEDAAQRCVRNDPREAWMKSMVDLVLLSMCDRILVMFESSYNNAALVRSFGEGRVTYYENRLTHQYTDKVLTEYRRGGPHADGIKKSFAEIWDMFGPVPRAGKGTSGAVSPEKDSRTDKEDPSSPIPHHPEQQELQPVSPLP